MTKAVQASRLPTRKLSVGAMVGPVVTEVWGRVMVDVYPPLAGPQMAMLAGALAAIAVAYWVKDRANVPVEIRS